MKTELTCYRSNREVTWQGDLPLLHEGLAVSLPGVARTRVINVTLHLGDDDGQSAWQSVVCSP